MKRTIVIQPSDLNYTAPESVRGAMTVRELMDILEDCDPESPVAIRDGRYFTALESVED